MVKCERPRGRAKRGVRTTFFPYHGMHPRMVLDDDDDALGWQSGTPKQHRARIFELTSGQSLSITQDTSMSAEALWACGAGAVVWEAAEATLAYLESAFAPTGLQGKAVVELGAGTGVIGLACAAMGARVTLTDLETALPLLRANAEQNYAATRAHHNITRRLEPIEIKALPWGEPLPDGLRADLVIACDCVYQPSAYTHLAATIAALGAPCLLSWRARGKQEEVVLEHLASAGFALTRVHSTPDGTVITRAMPPTPMPLQPLDAQAATIVQLPEWASLSTRTTAVATTEAATMSSDTAGAATPLAAATEISEISEISSLAEVSEISEISWAAVVHAADGKKVKDVLKSNGWLDACLKPLSLPAEAEGKGRPDGCSPLCRLAFPICAAGVASLRRAMADGSVPELRAVLAMEPMAAGALATKPPPKPQKPTSAANGDSPMRAVPGTGRTALPAALPRAHSRPKPPAQQRSFGGGAAARRSSGGGEGAEGGKGAEAARLPPAALVRVVECPAFADAAWLEQHAFRAREPAILRGLDLGACSGRWNASHLAATRCTSPSVSVHVCPNAVVDLAGHRAPNTPRNFVFRSMPFAEAVWRCYGQGTGEAHPAADGSAAAADEGAHDGATAAAVHPPPRLPSRLPQYPPLLESGERYYLRSVGSDPRKDAADFPSTFPELARECRLLPQPIEDERAATVCTSSSYDALSDAAGVHGVNGAVGVSARGGAIVRRASYHSSVLRLASDDTQLWTHFDVMDNALAQLTGRKRVVLWPPSEDANLYTGASSS